MSQKHDLRPIVASLRGEEGAGLVRRLVDPSSAVRVYLGIDPAGAQLGVLLAADRRHVPEKKNLPAGAGFDVRPHAVKGDPKDVVNLGVFCTDPACEDIFLHFMDDLVGHLLRETNPDSAVRTFLTRFSLWQRFFVAGGPGLLSDEAQCGLFAELYLLRDLLIPAAGMRVVDGWKGPEGSPQDFILASCALEVKCGRAKAGGRISISNEQQLDERPFPHLVLAHVAVATGGGMNQSLADLVTEVRGMLTGRPLDVFNDLLITACWADAHAAAYAENRLFVRGVRYFEVRDDFPRIRSGDFPAGVVDVTYRLDPAVLVPFELPRGTVEGWLKP